MTGATSGVGTAYTSGAPECHPKKPYIEEEQKTQWPKEKVQKDKQRSTKHTHKTKDRVTQTSYSFDIQTLLTCSI
jgi:hypothetical protein